MSKYRDIEDLIDKKVKETYQNGIKDGRMSDKQILELSEKASKEAYERGYKDGQDAREKSSYQLGYKDGHKEGLEDAWCCMRKIFKLPCETAQHLFHTAYYPEILDRFSAFEAIEGIKDWEEKQKQDAPNINDGSMEDCKVNLTLNPFEAGVVMGTLIFAMGKKPENGPVINPILEILKAECMKYYEG